MKKTTEIKKEAQKIISKKFYDNFFHPDMNTSLQIGNLYDLARKENKDLYLKTDGQFYLNETLEISEINDCCVKVDSSLSRATQDLSDQMCEKIKDKGHVKFQPRVVWIEGISLIDVDNQSITVELLWGT